MIQNSVTNECSIFLLPSAKWPWQSTISKTETGMFFVEASIFNNGHLEIMASSHKNLIPYISASFLIISKLLFIFCSWRTSSSSLDVSFLLGGIYVLEKFPENSRTLSNIGFWERLKGRPSEIIRSVFTTVRRVSLEVINFWEFPSIPKTSEPFEKILIYSQMLYLMKKWSLRFQMNWCDLIKWYFLNYDGWWIRWQ